MDLDDSSHHLRLRKGDVVEVAAAQEWVGEILLGIGSDDDDRSVFCPDGLVDLNDVEFHLVEYIEHVVLKIGIGLIDLVDEQHDPLIGDKGLSDLAHPDVLFDVADIPFGIPETAVIQPRQGIVLVKGIDELHARFDVENDQLHPRASAMAWASMVLPVPGSPFSRRGISKAIEMLTISASSSSRTYFEAPVNLHRRFPSDMFLLL